MTWWQALILGIVEGLTEYLPVSSTGHLILASWLLGFMEDPDRWAAANTFNIVIQSGAIVAVLGLYRQRVMQMIRGVLGKDEDGFRLARNLVIAFMPAAVLGPLLDDTIESYLFAPWPVIGALFAGAWLMLAVHYRDRLRERKFDEQALAEGCPTEEQRPGSDLDTLTWGMALIIGFGQCIAMWPGTSRSMMTIVAAMIVGMRAKSAAEFSFLLGVITLTAATGYKLVTGGGQMVSELGVTPLIVGFVASTISAALAVKWFVAFLTKHGLGPFGWYRIVLALVLAACLLSGLLTGFPASAE